MIPRQKLKPAVRAALAAAGKLDAFLARESALMTGGRPKAVIRQMLSSEFPEFREIAAAGKVSAVDGTGTPEEPPAPPPPDTEEYERIEGEVRRTTDWVAAVRFCFDYVDVDADTIDPSIAPSSGALSMLRHLQSNPSAKNEFYKTTIGKLLPTKSQLADEQEDVGMSDLQNLCDRVAEAAKKAKEQAACVPSPSS